MPQRFGDGWSFTAPDRLDVRATCGGAWRALEPVHVRRDLLLVVLDEAVEAVAEHHQMLDGLFLPKLRRKFHGRSL